MGCPGNAPVPFYLYGIYSVGLKVLSSGKYTISASNFGCLLNMAAVAALTYNT
jgi:hypothetical protein